MRLAIGALPHEANTFSRVPTTLEDIQRAGLHEGEDVLDALRGTGTPLGRVIDAAGDLGLKLLPTVALTPVAGGPLAGGVLDALADRLSARLRGLRGEADGLLLHLHGASVAEDEVEADAEILRRAREVVGTEIPIAVVVDTHANLSQRLVDLATVVVAGKERPPVDAREAGQEAVALLARIARGDARPTAAMRKLRLLVPLHGQSTRREPMRSLVERAREIERRAGVLGVALLPGFPYADVPAAGFSVLVTTDGDPSLAERLADELALAVWERRGDLLAPSLNVETAVHHAMALQRGPVVLADLGDDPGAGAPGDGTALLWALLDLGARDAALAVVADPNAVARALEVGVGQTAQFTVGGRVDRRHGYSIDFEARVTRIVDGRVTREGPPLAGVAIDLGRIAVLRARGRHEGQVDVIVTERRADVGDPAVLRACGIVPEERKIVVVKSSLDYQAAFGPLAIETLEVATPGITTPAFDFLEYHRAPRPIFPLDPLDDR